MQDRARDTSSDLRPDAGPQGDTVTGVALARCDDPLDVMTMEGQ